MRSQFQPFPKQELFISALGMLQTHGMSRTGAKLEWDEAGDKALCSLQNPPLTHAPHALNTELCLFFIHTDIT